MNETSKHMDNLETKKIYIVGIEGAGTSALALLYKNLGYQVSGSDSGDHFYQNVLRNSGVEVFQQFDKENVPKELDFAVYSSAYGEGNPEISEIKKRNILLLSYPQALGQFFNEKLGIAVCGTHGKTTTTAMLASAMKQAGLDPLALVGSNVIEWGSSVLLGKGEYFVAEADEYQNKLQYYNPWAAILTSVDWDHPDFFPDFEIYKQTFKDFVKRIPKTGMLVVWGDSAATLEVAESAVCKVITYGFGSENDFIILSHETSVCMQDDGAEKFEQVFEIEFHGKSLGLFRTPLSGKHNILNATSVIALTSAMQLELEKIKEALNCAQGTTRRFQYIGKFEKAILIDDYAHHPDEIRATLSGASDRYRGKKIWTVFHPHTFTRTKALLQEFSQSFDDTDRVIVIDVYGSARETQGGVSSQDLVKLINKYNFGKADYVPTIDDAIEYFREKAGEYDVLITMGAGDVWKIGDKLKKI